MVVEAGHLGHLGHAALKAVGQCHQVALKQGAMGIVEPVQVFDQQVAPQRRPAHQRIHLLQGLGVGLAALQLAAVAAV